MSNQKNTTTATATARKARIASARASVRELVLAERAAASAHREARSAFNRATHATRPVPVSVKAARAAGVKGERGTVTVSAEVAGKYVSLKAFAGKRVTFVIVGDSASVSVGAGKPSQAALKAAERAHVQASRKVASARANVARITGKSPVSGKAQEAVSAA
jgi:hypothetical protein